MSTLNNQTIDGLDAITVRSAAQFGGEQKDQDRTLWSRAMATACVCDGVSSSPSSDQAAEIASRFSPVLFKDESHLEANLRALADLLVISRIELQQIQLKISSGTSEAMRTMLQEVARENLSRSFQTTLVTASFARTKDVICASVVWVGDSGFFAFSGDGDLLATTLPYKNSTGKVRPPGGSNVAPRVRGIRFNTGDEILAKVICDASRRPSLAKRAGVRTGSAGNWLVCIPLDQAGRSRVRKNKSTNDKKDDEVLWLKPDDLLLVPRYLVGTSNDPRYRGYCRIRYSQAVRTLKSSNHRQYAMQDKSSATAVLPDHFYVGAWSLLRERFPDNAQFVLASDGFYGCFSNPRDIWRWLNANRGNLQNTEKRAQVLKQLHRNLQARAGDDDISFVWVFGHPGSRTTPTEGSANHAC